jgi:long-chain fatty acid transport protein
MKSNQKLKQLAIAVSLSLASASAFATNGYFPHGMGVKAKGMGGAAVAMTQDAFAGANNPAAAAFVGNRWDLGVDIFMPDRSASFGPGSAKSAERSFAIPEFGYNLKMSDTLGLGISIYGNGGMNTTYRTNILGGVGDLGVDLMQLTVAPTLAYKVNGNTSLGIAPLLIHQKFAAQGLQAFGIMSNPGSDTSSGVGVRMGVLSRVTDSVSIGASYSPKTNMGRFKKYDALFAEQGDFDIPSNWAVGISTQATPTVLIALDYSAINYGDVKSVSNPSTNQFPLGSDNGPGFGWKDINVIKLGAQWQVSNKATLRIGYNRGDNPISSRDAMFNILAPGVMKDHYTAGGTYALASNTEWSWFGMYAPSVKVSGVGMGGAPVTIEMKQYSFGLQYSKQF